MKKGELTTKTLIIIAVLSIGGILFMGWQANVVGQAALQKTACCTVGMWANAPDGYRQSGAESWTEFCYENETPGRCCMRAAKEKFSYDFKVLGARFGTCGSAPQVSYPVFVPQSAYYHRR